MSALWDNIKNNQFKVNAAETITTNLVAAKKAIAETDNKTYFIVGGILIVVVIIAFYFKFKTA